MESAKEKAIREAYGEHWEKVKTIIDENGWVKDRKFDGLLPIEMEFDFHDNDFYDKRRPKSLKGIETNNGWSLTSEKLPDEDKVYVFIRIDGELIEREFSFKKANPSTWEKVYTHWREKHEYPKPIY